MSISSVKKKINAKTLLGQSSALRENSVTLKEGVKKLAKILTERKKIRPSTLMATEKPEVVEQKRIGPGEYDKPEGGGFPLGPLLAGLGALGAAVGLAALDPGMFLRRFARASLRALKNLIERLLKTFKGVIESVGKVFKKIFNAIAENVKKLKNLIDDKLLKPLREAFENAINSKWFAKLRGFFDDIAESVKTFIKNSAERFKTFADDIFKRVKTFADDAIEGAITSFKKILDDISEKILKPLKSALTEFVERTKNFLKNGVANIGQAIAERAGKESFGEVIEVVSDALLKNFDNTVDGIVSFVKKPVDALQGSLKALGDAGIGPVKVRSLPGFETVENAVANISKSLDGIGSNIKSAVRDIPKQVGELVTDIKAGNTPVQKAFGFVAQQFDPEVMVSRFGKGLDFIKGVGSQVGGAVSTMKEGLSQLNVVEQAGKFKDDMIASVGGFIGDLKTSVTNNIQGTIKNVFTGSTQQQIIDQAKPAIDKIKDAKPVLDALEGAKKQGDKVFDLFGPLKKGWTEATGKFDQLFMLAEFAVSYGSAIDAQRRKKEGEEPAQFLGSDIKGQTMGDAILSVLGAFGGSAIGSALGTQIGATVGAAIGAPVFGVGAAVGAGVGGSLFGFLGSVLGGIIGEDIGKLTSSAIADKVTIPDPFLEGRNLFSKEGASDLTVLGMFGAGQSTPAEEQPQGGFGNLPPKPVKMTRDFQSMEDYTEYITDTEVVIITKENVVNNVMQTPTVQQSKGGMIPVPIGSGESVLDNFRSRALSQLAYN